MSLWSIPENSSGENWLLDEPVWPQEIPTEKDLLLLGEGAMISTRSFVEKGSILHILTDGASAGLGEVSGQSVLRVGEVQRDESEYVLIKLCELHPLFAYLLINVFLMKYS